MSKFKAILIDPAKRSVNDVVWDDEEFDQLHSWIGTDMLDHTPAVPYFDVKIIAWVDDIGMMKPDLDTFYIGGLYHQPLCGAALIWAAKGENTADVPFTADQLRASVVWSGKVSEVYEGGPRPVVG